MNLGKKILEYRKKKGLSQEQLGEKIEVTRQTISNWELGQTQPNPEQLKLLSKELNVSIDELLENDIKNVLIKKNVNTKRITNFTLKVFVIIIGIIVCLYINTVIDNSKNQGILIDETIICNLYGEDHSFHI